jgi:AGCS family alanine or glycine:cation symporter
MDAANQIVNTIGGYVWGPVMLVLIVGVGIYLTVRLKVLQITKFVLWNKLTLGLIFKKKALKEGSVTPFQAFCTAMAATAGVGNLVGVSGSILVGGPGAILWMFISGFFGMVTKFAEIVLAVHFRRRNKNGELVGGPMYYISKGLGKNWRWLAIIFSILGAICAFGIGNMTQINAAAVAVGNAVAVIMPAATLDTGDGSAFRWILGVILAILVGLVILGGFKRIGETVEKLVPFIGIFCIVASIVGICFNADMVGQAFIWMFEGAFKVEAAVGGILGYTIMQAARYGIARGVFTNEAGLGSAPIAHAAADVDHPVKQGFWGCFEVFADTLVMCTLTALLVLTAGVFTGIETVEGAQAIAMGLNETGEAWTGVLLNGAAADGNSLINAAYASAFGPVGTVLLAFSILVFAYCTTLSWSLYGLRCFQYLTNDRGTKIYLIIFCLVVVIAAAMQIGLAWNIADVLNGLMAFPNLVGLIFLSPLVIKITKDYFAGGKQYKIEEQE